MTDDQKMILESVRHSLEDPPSKRRRVNWKDLAMLITALVGAVGFFWNKLEGCAQADRTDKLQAASYEVLAGKVEALYLRVGVVEEVMRMLPALFTKKQPDAERMMATLHSDKPEPGPIKLTPPEVLFQKSDLPSFQDLKAAAK